MRPHTRSPRCQGELKLVVLTGTGPGMDCALPKLREDLEKCQDTYHDVGTGDFLLQHMESHEKMAWMLRAFLEGESV